MKAFKIVATIFVLLICNFIYAQVLSINPSDQSLAIEGGEQISVNVTFLNQNNQYPINYKVSLWSGGGTYGGFLGGIPILNQDLSLAQNQSQHHTYNFIHGNHNTNNVTITYTFKVVWMVQNGLNIEATSYFKINVTFLGNGCPQSPPAIRNVGNTLSTSAVLWWDSHPNEYGYKVRVKDALTGQNYYRPILPQTIITDNYYELDNLTAGRSYYWAVKTVCPDGSESGWSNIDHSVFTTQPSGCLAGASMDKTISSNKDVRVSGSVYASSTVNPNLDVKFRGSNVVLRPGFNVKGQSTGVFRAYVDPCTPGSSIGSKHEWDVESSMNESKILPSLSPNPTTTILNIDNIEDIQEWKFVDINGKVVESGKVNNSIQTKIAINTSRLIPGVYYFNAIMKNGELFQKTVMKK